MSQVFVESTLAEFVENNAVAEAVIDLGDVLISIKPFVVNGKLNKLGLVHLKTVYSVAALLTVFPDVSGIEKTYQAANGKMRTTWSIGDAFRPGASTNCHLFGLDLHTVEVAR